MKKLNKKQRHKIYKKALNVLQENSHFWGAWEIKGICHALMYCAYPKEISYETLKLLNCFPEFALFESETGIGFWFDGLKERETVLTFCIEMTK